MTAIFEQHPSITDSSGSSLVFGRDGSIDHQNLLEFTFSELRRSFSGKYDTSILRKHQSGLETRDLQPGCLSRSKADLPNGQQRIGPESNSSFLKAFSSCGVSGLSHIGDAVGKAVQGDVDGFRDALSCKGREFSDSNYYPEEDEDLQMRRLTSWGTTGTFGTIGTNNSEITLEFAVAPCYDDDGNPIDPKLLEKAAEHREKRSQRERVVKFEYPPVRSLKQCPRIQPEDLPQLFYTEDELDQIEDDRASTYIADDIEIVAVSTSLSENGSPMTPSTIESSAAKEDNFPNYVGTPSRKWSKKSPRTFSFSDSKRPKDADSYKSHRHRPSTPGPLARSAERDHQKNRRDKSDEERDQRLLKGVQIFLRERSTGK